MEISATVPATAASSSSVPQGMDVDEGRVAIDFSRRISTEDLPTFSSEDESIVTPKGTCLVDVPVSGAMLQAANMETTAPSSTESVEAILPTIATDVMDDVLTGPLERDEDIADEEEEELIRLQAEEIALAQ
jgi:hypothetical protein